MAWRFARLALERSVDASASRTRDSVLHFAAAKPDHAAISATIESRMASMIEIVRFCFGSACEVLECSPISLPTSAVESPSGIPASIHGEAAAPPPLRIACLHDRAAKAGQGAGLLGQPRPRLRRAGRGAGHASRAGGR